MDSVHCSNCKSLKNQCKELRDEVILLKEKLDNVLELLFCDKSEKCSQTDFHDSIEKYSQTDPINLKSSSVDTQTDPINLESSSIDNSHNMENINTTSHDLFDLFCQSGTSPATVTPVSDLHESRNGEVMACQRLPDHPFSWYSFEDLDSEIPFVRSHNNRSTCYYGQYSYSCGSTFHEAKPLPPFDSYLHSILVHLRTVVPNFHYNSVLITRYNDGNDNLRFHSDNEPEIVEGSDIVTISLGGPRVAFFRKISDPSYRKDIFLDHGDVFIMSQRSQSFYEHCIPPDSIKQPRISITCRLIQPHSNSHSPSVDFLMPAATVISDHDNGVLLPSTTPATPLGINTSTSTPNQSTPCTLYISSSMFRGIDEDKMSSVYQTAKVLYYPGATAKQILIRLKDDPKFSQINPINVNKIYLMCGTNNIDQLIGVKRKDYANIISSPQVPDQMLYETRCDIYNLVSYIHSWAQSASINIINILPRVSACRNAIINQLNSYIMQLSDNLPYVNLVGTEMHRSLFSYINGHRKKQFFSNKGADNVHLNRSGLIRLVKYLKYSAHQ